MGYSAVQEKAAFWVGTVGLRYKFGKKTHVKNTGIVDYEAYYMPQYDNEPLQQQVDDQENNIRQLQDRLNKLNEDLDKAKEKVAQCCDAPRGVTPSARQAVPTNPYATPSFNFENADIAYEPAKHEITPSLKKGLDDLANTLKAYPNIKIRVIGHTDNTGIEAFNKELSQKRADAVKDYLVTQGIAGGRITTQGVSDTQPVASNATAEGRQKNRRIEVDFITE
jgi:outer membrane protein OmpA-like peptidoglycan-associated protein